MTEALFAQIPLDQALYNVSLPSFEGPLDLLLHLIQKHELDVLDIPIAFVTERYLDYLRVMQTLNLDVAAEYLVMAATLAHLKSKQLLPPSEDEPDESAIESNAGEPEDPRADLVRRLLEYQRFKTAAEELASREVSGRDVFPRGADLRAELDERAPLAPLGLFDLVAAFQRLAKARKLELKHEVTADRVSISERIHQLVDRLRIRRSAAFDELFEGQHSIGDMVVTFLALLEMTRLRMTRLYQTSPLERLHIALTLTEVPEGERVIDDVAG